MNSEEKCARCKIMPRFTKHEGRSGALMSDYERRELSGLIGQFGRLCNICLNVCKMGQYKIERGKHEGLSFRDLFEKQPRYSLWVLSECNDNRFFVGYITYMKYRITMDKLSPHTKIDPLYCQLKPDKLIYDSYCEYY